MLIHHYSQSNGEYLSSGQPDADPRNPERWLVPSWATFDEPPARTPTTWPFYRDNAWTLLPDFRGRLCYRTDTGEPVEIATAGKTPDELGLTTEPQPSPRHAWINGALSRPRCSSARNATPRWPSSSDASKPHARPTPARPMPTPRACSTTKASITSKAFGLPDGTRFGRPGRHVPRCGDVADYAGAVRTASASAAGTATATATGTGIEAPARRTQRTCSSGRGPRGLIRTGFLLLSFI